MDEKMEKKGLIGFNKFTIVLVLIYFVCGVGVSYAYFAFNYEQSSVIVGNVVNIDADLSVELVVGNNDGLVPMIDEALSNALNAVGTTNGACIDSLGNLSCQVYKITLTNNASRLQHLTGTIELYAKDGSSNAYSNLKWKELTNTTTIKDGVLANGMNKSILVSDLTLESKESKTWYVGLWLSEIDSDQRELDKGEFEGKVTFESVEFNDLAQSTMIPNAKSDEGIDFSKTSTATGTNGIYLKSETANDVYPIYYYRGAVDNNLIFANFCWKIVRTTDTGGLKLIYNGIPTDGECSNTGNASQIGTKAFNSSYTSPAYVGYMYGTVHNATAKDMTSDTTAYVYGNDVSYANGTYTLVDTKSAVWSTSYNGGLNNNHYTCFTTGTTCTSVYYVHRGDSENAYYMTMTGGKKIEDILEESLNYNTTSSTIKGSKTASGTLDYWYYTAIEGTYGDYVEDTVWCNDRSIYALNGWDPDGGSITLDYLRFGAYGRVRKTYSPSLSCEREIDSFTVDEANGNGDLDYPVGLLTADEMVLAGGQYGDDNANSEYYLYTGNYYWAGTPYYFGHNVAVEFFVSSTGNLYHDNVDNAYGVRPSISLKRGFTIAEGGDGTTGNPYVVE